jgi:hypothetical protein
VEYAIRITKLGMSSVGVGLLVLEIQSHIPSLLVACCKLMLHDTTQQLSDMHFDLQYRTEATIVQDWT